jgi:Icc protein
MTDYANYPTPEHFILHISDTHLVQNRGPLHDIVDSDANLEELFEGFDKSNTRPDAIVFTGDIADTAAVDAYRRMRAMVEPIAERYGSQLIWVMGNHDKREPFYSELLGQEESGEPYDRVFDINGLRVIALDSTVPGQHWGELTDDQLAWLADQLKTPAPDGTLLALHHPPVPSHLGLIRLFELHDQDRFADVVRGTDVRGILGGHLHYSTVDTFAGVPVSVASATCYTQDVVVPYPTARGQAGGQSYNLVHVYADHVQHSIVPIGQWPTAYEMAGESLAKFLAMTPDEQLAAVGATVGAEQPH